MEKKLYRDEFRKKIGGVCAGLAKYFTIDVTLMRLFFVLACIFHGTSVPVYIILWIVLPKKPYLYTDPTVDYKVPPQGAEGTIPPGGSPFGGNPYQGNPFGNNPPFPNPPQPNPPFQTQPRGTSLAAIIFGTVLITVGGWILLYNLDILPDWDFWNLWPVIPIVAGCIMMLSGNKKKPEEAWQAPKEDTLKEDAKTDNTTETNPPAEQAPEA